MRHAVQIARQLRKRATLAEKLLWQKLRNRHLEGLRFRRQHPIGRYIADLYCPELELIIELEGTVHDEVDQRSCDEARFVDFRTQGLRILRIRVVTNDMSEVLETTFTFNSHPTS